MVGVSFLPEGWRDLPCLPFCLCLFLADPWAPGPPRTSCESSSSSWHILTPAVMRVAPACPSSRP